MGQDEHLESLFDILYADEGRLKSFYTQVFSGSLKQVTTQSHTEDTHRKDLSVGPASLRGSKSGGTSSSEQIKEVYVPGDLVHIDVLSKLRERGYLKSRLDNVQAGNLVSLENVNISIIDASNLHEFMNAIPIKDIIPGTKHERREQEKDLKLVQRLINALYKMMPLGIQVRCRTGSGQKMWGTLENHCLRERPTTLSLKHGSHLQGRWRIIGIVDAVPSDHQMESSGNIVHDSLGDFQNVMRDQLGRSSDEYGILPIFIFGPM